MVEELPTEVLMTIFLSGCDELEDLSDYQEPEISRHPRCRKEFAARVRRVCRRWRTLIDSSSSVYTSRFWVVKTGLTSGGDLRDTHGRAFGRLLAKFKYDLTTSDGCDLIVSFILKKSGRALLNDLVSETGVQISNETLLSLKLLHYGMIMMLPFKHQIWKLHMKSEYMIGMKSLLHFIQEIGSCRRLNRVDLLYAPTLNPPNIRPIPSISHFLKTPATPGLEGLLDSPYDQIKPFASAFFSNVETLTIPHYGFLHDVLPVTKPTFKHLILHNNELQWDLKEKYDLTTVLRENGSRFESLTSLTVVGYTKRGREVVPWNKNPAFTLNNVRKLDLQEAASSTSVEEFLNIVSLPFLEVLSIDYKHPTHDFASSSSPRSDEGILIRQFPRLISLEMVFFDWSSIRIAEKLKSSPFERFHIVSKANSSSSGFPHPPRGALWARLYSDSKSFIFIFPLRILLHHYCKLSWKVYIARDWNSYELISLVKLRRVLSPLDSPDNTHSLTSSPWIWASTRSTWSIG